MKKSDALNTNASIGLYSTISLMLGFNLANLVGIELSLALCGAGLWGIGTVLKNALKVDEWEELWKAIGFGNRLGEIPQKIREYETDYSKVYYFSLPIGMNTELFERIKLSIANFLKTNNDNRISIELINEEIKVELTNELETNYAYETPEKHNCKIPILLGRSAKTIELLDLVETKHLLIASATGSGKSTLVRVILTYLIETTDINLHLFDFKNGNELQMFGRCKNVITFCKEREKAYEELLKFLLESERRSELFWKKNCVDITEFNRRYKKNKLNYEIAVIDEYADISGDKMCQNIVQTIVQKARSTGMFIIICTQRPSVDVIKGTIKANVPARIGLKVSCRKDSEVIMDETGLEKLRKHGHAIYKMGVDKTEIQVFNLTPPQARSILKKHYTKKNIFNLAEAKKKKENGVIKGDFAL